MEKNRQIQDCLSSPLQVRAGSDCIFQSTDNSHLPNSAAADSSGMHWMKFVQRCLTRTDCCCHRDTVAKKTRENKAYSHRRANQLFSEPSHPTPPISDPPVGDIYASSLRLLDPPLLRHS